VRVWLTRTIKTSAFAASIFLVTGTLVRAQEAWQVTRVSGDAWAIRDNSPARLAAGTQLATGDVVRTGPKGRVQISRGAEAMMLGANTSIALAPGARPEVTSVVQQTGTLTLDIEKKSTPHFEVETPFLVAAVKGTRFVVTVRSTGAAVDVSRGLVQVAAVKTGQSIAVAPGQRTSITPETKTLSVVGPGQHAAMEMSEPHATRAEPLAVPKAGLASPLPGASHRKTHLRRAAKRPAEAVPAAARVEGQDRSGPAPATDAQDGAPGYRDTIWTRGAVSRGGASTQRP